MPLNGMPSAAMLSMETVWFDANQYHEAEKQYQEYQNRSKVGVSQMPESIKASPVSSLVTEIAQTRQKIQNFLKSGEADSKTSDNLWNRVQTLENEKAVISKRLTSVEERLEEILQKVLRLNPSLNAAGDSLKFLSMNGEALKKCVHTADNALNDSLGAVPDIKSVLEGKGVSPQVCKAIEEEKRKAVLKIVKVLDETMAAYCHISSSSNELSGKSGGQNLNNGPTDDDDDIDLFGSEEETEEEIRVKEERVKAYADKKSKKPALVAKSSVILDVKPWDDETDMKSMEVAVRKITMDGLVWGASKLVPLAYGIKKLQIIAVVEDEKVSIDTLQEQIEEINDMVQSVDIAAFNKL